MYTHVSLQVCKPHQWLTVKMQKRIADNTGLDHYTVVQKGRERHVLSATYYTRKPRDKSRAIHMTSP